MEIINKKYRNWSHSDIDQYLVSNTSINDVAVHTHYGSVYEHKVVGITLKGVHLDTGGEHVFVKWTNVRLIKKPANNHGFYRLEWTYRNGKQHWTYANTLEMAEEKAKPLIKKDSIIFVEVIYCEHKVILKDYSLK